MDHETGFQNRRIITSRQDNTIYGSTAFNKKLREKLGEKQRPRSALEAEEREGIIGAGSLIIVPLQTRY